MLTLITAVSVLCHTSRGLAARAGSQSVQLVQVTCKAGSRRGAAKGQSSAPGSGLEAIPCVQNVKLRITKNCTPGWQHRMAMMAHRLS